MSRFNDTLLINFCKTLQNLGEESVGELLMGEDSALHLDWQGWNIVKSIQIQSYIRHENFRPSFGLCNAHGTPPPLDSETGHSGSIFKLKSLRSGLENTRVMTTNIYKIKTYL